MELLAPAGTYESFIAAINAGADAVYLGGKAFSARAYSSNFSNEDIKNLIKYAHVRDVKVYVALNTLVFEDEFFEAVEFARFLYESDVDAILLQDLGLASYLHKTMPDLILHASTQLNCHNIIQAKSLINLGFKRLVLAREVSLEQAKEIKDLGVEVEVFVQGALCVSYSGNCLMSSFIGGRSGNRGRCAQPCRHHVELCHDEVSQGEYAISTKDLMTLDKIDEYRKYDIDSLKIEGRMKREEYVYQVVSSYRKAIDQVEFNFKEELEKIERIFNRKFTKGYLFNESRTTLLNQDTPSNLGVPLGRIIKVKNNFVYMKIIDEVEVGDGIKFLNENLDGMLLTRFSLDKEFVKTAHAGQVISFSRNNLNLKEGTLVNKTTDSKLNHKIQELIKIDKKVPLKLTLVGELNGHLNIIISDSRNNVIEYESTFVLEKAKNNPTSKERIISQMSKFDEYPYYYEQVDYKVDESVFIPISLLNQARREALELITLKRENINHYSLKNVRYTCELENQETKQTIIKVETLSQLEEVRKLNYPIMALDELNYLEGYTFLRRINHKDVNKTKNNQMTSYYKEVEEGFKLYSYYGNVTNSYTLDMLFEHGYNLVFASVECSKNQIALMNKAFYGRHNFYPNLGMHVYGYIDYMIMKSCPISNANGIKKDHCNLCKKNRYYLKDHMDAKFPIVTNEDCTSRILSNRPISLTSKIKELNELGIQNFIIDFTIEGREEVKRIISCFEQGTSTSNKDFFGHYINKVE